MIGMRCLVASVVCALAGVSVAQNTPASDPARPAAPAQVQPVGPKAPAQPTEAERGVMRTDALRLLSEAEQYFSEGATQKAFERFTTLRDKFLSVLDANDVARVRQSWDELRQQLGMTVLPDGRVLPLMGDDEIDGLLQLCAGSYATDLKAATEAAPALTYNCARVIVDGLTNALYFEVCRADDQANPFRQGVMTYLRVQGKLRLRIMDIANPGLKDALVGLWAAPELFPAFSIDKLVTNVELEMTRAEDGSGYAGRTSHPFPIFRAGAVEMTSQMKITADGLSIADRGTDAAGTPVWGPADDAGLVFRHVESPVKVTRLVGGLATIDLVAGQSGGYALEKGGEIALHFSQWTTEGVKVDSSRQGARGPVRVRYPIAALAGLDQGLSGITKGARRRIIIPPALGYGDQTRGAIPPNSVLIFDVEALWLQAPEIPPAAPPLPATGPAGPAPQGSPTATPSAPAKP